MASARFAWGIDIGNRALKAVKLVRDGDSFRVDDFELLEHEHVLSNAGDNKESLIQSALANFIQRHPMKGGIVGVGVSGQSSFARFIKLPPVEDKKIPEIVRFEAIQQIPFPLDDVEWSYQLFRTPDSPDVEVGIFAMRKDLVNHHIKYFTDFDLNVQVVQMNPLAVYNAMHYDQRLKGTTMVIDLGAENTDLIICDNESVWMRSIPIGGNSFTETLVKGFKLPFAKAEDLKRNAATSKYARQIFQAMRPVFADLVAEIQRSVGFYASVHRDSRIKKIIALGGTFRLPGLQKYLQQNLSLDVERLDNIAAGAPTDPKAAATFNENLVSMIAAYGLAVQAMGEGKITSSLLPTAIRREKVWKEKTPIFAAAAATFVVGTGVALGGYFLQDVKFKNAAGTQAEIDRTQSTAQQLDSEWTQIQSAGATERELIKNVLGLKDYRDLWPNLLKDIQNAVPSAQPEVVQGLKENKLELLKSIPRKDRQLITIRSIGSQYQPNIAMLLTGRDDDLRRFQDQGAMPTQPTGENAGGERGEGDFGGGGGEQNPAALGGAAATGKAVRGFIITIKGSSPYAKANSLVNDKFCTALTKIRPTQDKPKKEYAVAKAVMVSSYPIKDNPPRLQELRAAYENLRRALPQPAPPAGGPPAAAAAANAVEDSGLLDRVTDEDMKEDWEFTVVLAVQLDPPPPPPPAAQPQASAAP